MTKTAVVEFINATKEDQNEGALCKWKVNKLVGRNILDISDK